MVTLQEQFQLDKFIDNDTVDVASEAQGNVLPLMDLLSYVGITTNPKAGIYYVPSEKEIVVKQNGAVLKGYNFSGVSIAIYANNVTVENCTFNDQNAVFTVRQMAGYGGMTVQNCTFNGGDNVTLAGFVESDSGYATISNNRFIDTPSHAVQIPDGVISNNYFSGGGYEAGAHADAICVVNTTGPVLITGNYVDWTNSANALSATNNAIRITTDVGSVSDVTVTNNVLLGGTYSVYVDYGNAPGANGKFSNVNIYDNYIGDYTSGAYYPTDPPGVTLGSYVDVGFDNPTLSTAAWAADQASFIAATNNFVEANSTSTSISAANVGSTTLYGDGVNGLHMNGGAGLTIFVGGAGTQYMWGGSGENIYSFLSVADSTPQSPDSIGNFNVAKDVIDLHALNANPAGSFSNFTFIGGAAFSSAGGQVRVVQDVADDETLVEADLVGDSSADIEIRLSGLLNLTAANFALTTVQYNADTAAYTTMAEFESSQSSLNQVAGGFSIVDTAANVQAGLATLEGDAAHINAITATGGTVSASTSVFVADETVLKKIVGGFALADTAANVQAQIDALERDVADVVSVTLSNSTALAPAVLTLTAADASSDAAILAKIGSPYVLDATANGTSTVTGHGNGLTINVGAGDNVVTGGGANETFHLSSNFGSMQITDFAPTWASPSHDTISLSTSDFGNWATLVSDGRSSGPNNANTTFTAADGASLTLVGISLANFQHASAALQSDFTFHA